MMRFLPISLLLFVCQLSYATTFIVDSKASFDDAADMSSPGDSILWADGEYRNVELEVEADGLYISAQTLGGVVFTGFSLVELVGDDLTYRGFQYVDGDINDKDVINIRGSRILVTEINIRAYTCYKYLRVRESSQYVTITYCNFENRLNLIDQNILSILVNNNQPGYHKVQYCSFKNFDGGGNDDGIEPIRIGVSSQADFASRSLVEFCYFTRCDGDGEIISSKARQNVYRYNTFDGNTKAELVLRHGAENTVYGNFFMNGKGGIRVREGQHHYIYNNYFYNLQDRAIYLMDDDADPLDDINIAFNTIVNCGEVRLGQGPDAPTNVTFANNIFADPKDNRLFQDETTTEQWISNIAFGGLGFAPTAGLSEENPLLVENTAGLFQISAGSPAIDAVADGFKPLPQYEGMDPVDTTIELDIMQQARPQELSQRDIGCSEYPPNILLQPYATEENTGPHYNTNDLTSVTEVVDDAKPLQTNVYPSPALDEITVEILTDEVEDRVIRIYDVQGQVVKAVPSKRLQAGASSDVIDISDLLNGTYILQVCTSSGGQLIPRQAIQFVKRS